MLPDISRQFLNRMLTGSPIGAVQVGAQDGEFTYAFD
jgi:type VI secretion system protein VasG